MSHPDGSTDTAPAPPAPRPPTLKELAQLVDGQRRDFDELAQLLVVHDQQWNSERRSTEALLNTAVGQLNRVTKGLSELTAETRELNARLTFYEKELLILRKGRKAFDDRERRRIQLSKEAAHRAVEHDGGESQTEWPMGPAPARACPAAAEGEEHGWQLLGLFEHVSPPVPTFGCARCKWTWTRGWTQPEFDRWLAQQDEKTRAALAELRFPGDPPYAPPDERVAAPPTAEPVG